MTGANPQVFATDTQPLDGRASLQYVVGPDVQATAAPQTRFGVSASVIKNARGLGIDLHTRDYGSSAIAAGLRSMWRPRTARPIREWKVPTLPCCGFAP